MPDIKVEEKKEEAPKEEVKPKVETKPVEKPKPETKEEKTKKRTKKQFKKLKKSNKQLKEERDEFKSVIDSLKPKQPPTPKPEPPQPGMGPGKTTYTDPRRPDLTQNVPSAQKYSHLSQKEVDDAFSGMMDEQGYVDANKLFGSLRGMNERLVNAEERARQAEAKVEQVGREQRDFEESQEVRRVHGKYPQVDPKSEDFNSELFDSVRNELIGQLMDGKRDFMAATEKWYNKLYAREEEKVATKKEKEEQTEKEEAKAQINATTPKSGSMTDAHRDSELEALVEGTKKGVKGALAERLKRSGHGPA